MARAAAIDSCSCRHHERSRRCFRRWAAPVTSCQLRSIRKDDAQKGALLKIDAWLLWLLWLFLTRALRWDVYGHKSSRLVGNPETPGLNSEEEAEKCSTERRRMLSIITHHSHAKPVKVVSSFPSASCAAELKTEASTEHTSPFCVRTEKNTSGSESISPQKMSANSPKAPSTDVIRVSTVEPSIVASNRGISRRIQHCVPQATLRQSMYPESNQALRPTAPPEEFNSLYSTSNTQTPDTGLQGTRPYGNNAPNFQVRTAQLQLTMTMTTTLKKKSIQQ